MEVIFLDPSHHVLLNNEELVDVNLQNVNDGAIGNPCHDVPIFILHQDGFVTFSLTGDGLSLDGVCCEGGRVPWLGRWVPRTVQALKTVPFPVAVAYQIVSSVRGVADRWPHR